MVRTVGALVVACAANRKPYFWADDSDTGGNSLRRDLIPCGAFIP